MDLSWEGTSSAYSPHQELSGLSWTYTGAGSTSETRYGVLLAAPVPDSDLDGADTSGMDGASLLVDDATLGVSVAYTDSSGTTTTALQADDLILLADHPWIGRGREAQMQLDESGCVPLPAFDGPANPAGICKEKTRLPLELAGVSVTAARVHGVAASEPPDAVRVSRIMGPDPASSGWLDPEQPGRWSTAASHALDCAGTECIGWYQVEAKLETGQSCADVTPVQLCLDIENTVSDRDVDTDAACQAGSAVFQLLPISERDADRDGLSAVTYLPMMLWGTGTLTNQAWITNTKSLSPGVDLWMVLADSALALDGHDQIENASTTVVALSTTPTPYNSGSLSGYGPFVVTDSPGAANPRVRLEWTCSSDATTWTDVTPTETRYVLDLAELDCGSEQKLLLTHKGPFVSVEAYGNPNYRVNAPLHVSGGQEFFQFERELLTIKGQVISHDLAEAELQLDEISISGVSICDPATLTLPAL